MLPTPIDAVKKMPTPPSMLNAGGCGLPGNCWGDLWRFDAEVNPNDADTEGFERDSLGLAMEAVHTTPPPATVADRIEVPVPVDTSRLFLVGLGDGGAASKSCRTLTWTPPS